MLGRLRTATRASSSRFMSMVAIERDESSRIATLRMSRPPVNSLNKEMLADLKGALDEVDQDKAVKGIVLASISNKVFSAGLDITELYGSTPERMSAFWTNLQDVWLALYGSSKPTVAAINGSSPAGGCLLAMACDWRIMATGNFKIGLNETQLGIVAPPFFCDTMVNTVGTRHTERLLQLGALIGSDEALKIGLVDELRAPEEVESAAKEQLAQWLKIPASARFKSKMLLRGPALERLRSNKAQDTSDFVNFANSEAVQKMLGAYLAALKSRSK